ncbi:MAG TPA: DUF6580 family putative transport protein [Steroidobacteraceae bacterium]|nr:DUF6580 family putative transport protein [Steroidobacteraceae bacterium]
MKEEASMLNPRLNTLIMMIVAAAATRLIPHPPNLTSVTALAPFGGAYFLNRWLAFVVPLGALLLSDLILGLYPHMEVPYLSFALIVCIGFRLQQHRTAPRIAGATLLSALVFFIITNFGVWAFDSLYPRTLPGLVACYTAAIPFIRNTLLGDVGYTAVLFGGFQVLERRFSGLREPRVAIRPYSS